MKQERTCKGCGETLPISFFQKRDYRCNRGCRQTYIKEYRRKVLERDRKTLTIAQRREKNQRYWASTQRSQRIRWKALTELATLFPDSYRKLYEYYHKSCMMTAGAARSKAFSELKAKFPDEYKEVRQNVIDRHFTKE